MDNETLLLILIVVILLGYMVFPMFCAGGSYENFDDSKPLKSQVGNPDLNNEIAASPIMGLPDEVIPPWGYDTNKFGDFSELHDGADGGAGMAFNLCSQSCCSPQYPLPFAMPVDPLVCDSKQKFLPSSYACNNGWQNSGCLCMTEEQTLLLNTRGGNS